MAGDLGLRFSRIKILRQRAITIGADTGWEYGGWRMWCGFCGAYEWSGPDIAASMDYARRHCAREATASLARAEVVTDGG